MTMSALAQELGSRLPSPKDKESANQLCRILAAHAAADMNLRVVDSERKSSEVALTPAISRLLMELLRHVGSGDAVTLVPVSQMLTTQQAADILNVSRPFFISLLEKEQIAFSMVGRHRRVKAEALFAYKRERDARRSRALADLAELDAGHL